MRLNYCILVTRFIYYLRTNAINYCHNYQIHVVMNTINYIGIMNKSISSQRDLHGST